MAEIVTLVVGPLDVNCYIVWRKGATEAFVIDPGGDAAEIRSALDGRGLTARYIINTHGHFDHVGADAALKAASGANVAIHPMDADLLKDAHDLSAFFGQKTPRQSPPDMLLEDGMTLEAGGLELKVIHTPGHSRGGVCLYIEKDGLLFTGDTLFAGSVGRTDFEGGSMEELMASIKKKLLPLGDSVMIFPGHGPQSTIGDEKTENPFIAGRV